MADYEAERRPASNRTAIETPTKKSPAILPERVAGAPTSLSGFEAAMAELDVINTAYAAGYDVGFAHGRNARRSAAEAIALHEAAAEVVTRMSGFPERDRDADREAARRRADRFGQPTFGGPR